MHNSVGFINGSNCFLFDERFHSMPSYRCIEFPIFNENFADETSIASSCLECMLRMQAKFANSLLDDLIYLLLVSNRNTYGFILQCNDTSSFESDSF